ncbi:hypothetical protein Tsubulata_024586 [Turnera subulata]|uniref:Uncharacterized protein n=1 Tax=Turnera subulata TaxID=218843 RepID=A0A9Q0J370_9ROSI|nr:hypothetical protein Tsubulata_024586 [Turnera subulata]
MSGLVIGLLQAVEGGVVGKASPENNGLRELRRGDVSEDLSLCQMGFSVLDRLGPLYAVLKSLLWNLGYEIRKISGGIFLKCGALEWS